MKYKGYRLLFSLGILLFIAGGVFFVQASSVSEVEQAKKELEQKKQDTEKKVSELKNEKGDLLTYIEKLDKQTAELDEQIEEMGQKIAKTKKNLKKTKKELETAKEEEKKQYASMKKRIKYMYENGGTDYIGLLLEANNVVDFLNYAEYVAKVSAYDKKLLENHKKMKATIEEKEQSLEEKAQKLEILNEDLEYQQSVVDELAKEKEWELREYNKDIDKASDEAKAYAKEIDKQEQMIEDLLEQERKRIEEEERRKEEARKEEARREEERRRQEAANSGNTDSGNTDSGNTDSAVKDEPDYSQQTTDFRWPLNVAGRISSTFGGRDQPTAGASTNHKGIDIAAPSGTQIVAAASGKVVTATYSSSAGNYIMIYHGNSTYTVYMHCSSLDVTVGDEVIKGQNIAKVGSTGVSTGSHLHFGISLDGEYVNPLNYVSQ